MYQKRAQIFKDGQFDGIISVGGGSTLDVGKAIALAVVVGQKSLRNYKFGSTISTKTPPKIHTIIAIQQPLASAQRLTQVQLL